MSTTVLIALTLSDTDSETAELGDVAEAMYARLEEFYPDSLDGFCAPASRRVVATTSGVAKHIFDALWVGLGNEDEMGDAALHVAHSLSLAADVVTTADPSRTGGPTA